MVQERSSWSGYGSVPVAGLPPVLPASDATLIMHSRSKAALFSLFAELDSAEAPWTPAADALVFSAGDNEWAAEPTGELLSEVGLAGYAY